MDKFIASFNDLQRKMFLTSVSKGWYDCSCSVNIVCTLCVPLGALLPDSMEPTRRIKRRNVPEMIALMHSELSEMLEAYRDGRMVTDISTGKPEGFGPELADVFIRGMDLAQFLGIDLAEEIIRKAEYNKTRPHRHGGKVC